MLVENASAEKEKKRIAAVVDSLILSDFPQIKNSTKLFDELLPFVE